MAGEGTARGKGGMLLAVLCCAGNKRLSDFSDVPILPFSGTSGEKGPCVTKAD